MIFEEKYPELHEEVRYLLDRNIEKKEALLKKVGHLPGINTTSEKSQKELLVLSQNTLKLTIMTKVNN